MTIQNIEAAVLSPRVLSVLDALANALGVSTASLIADEPFQARTYVDVRESLATNVKLLRTQLTWSQADLELQSGVNRSMIARIERCQRNPSLDTLVRLASALDVPVEQLLRQ